MSQSQLSFSNYEGFVEKFKPKKTTDDCYTPPEIYEVIMDYVAERWSIEEKNVVRPFYPGGDYLAYEYPRNCCVVDNPPFSILSQILNFYVDENIKFFLFAPSLTIFNNRKNCMNLDHIIGDCNITYENGATVKTGFITNLEERYVLEADPELGQRIKDKNAEIQRRNKKQLDKYEYPDDIITAAGAQWIASKGTSLKIARNEATLIHCLDAQKKKGKTIFGSGLLLTKQAAAKQAAAIVWELSPREKKIQEMIK